MQTPLPTPAPHVTSDILHWLGSFAGAVLLSFIAAWFAIRQGSRKNEGLRRQIKTLMSAYVPYYFNALGGDVSIPSLRSTYSDLQPRLRDFLAVDGINNQEAATLSAALLALDRSDRVLELIQAQYSESQSETDRLYHQAEIARNAQVACKALRALLAFYGMGAQLQLLDNTTWFNWGNVLYPNSSNVTSE